MPFWTLIAAAVLVPLLFLGVGLMYAKAPRLYFFSHEIGLRNALLPKAGRR